MFKHKLKEKWHNWMILDPIRCNGIYPFPTSRETVEPFPRALNKNCQPTCNLTSSFLNLQGLKPFPWKSKERVFKKLEGTLPRRLVFEALAIFESSKVWRYHYFI